LPPSIIFIILIIIMLKKIIIIILPLSICDVICFRIFKRNDPPPLFEMGGQIYENWNTAIIKQSIKQFTKIDSSSIYFIHHKSYNNIFITT